MRIPTACALRGYHSRHAALQHEQGHEHELSRLVAVYAAAVGEHNVIAQFRQRREGLALEVDATLGLRPTDIPAGEAIELLMRPDSF